MILSRRLRESPFEKRVIEHGVKGFTLYNKMTLPLVFDTLESDYEHLCEHVQIWDVACERQVEIVGPEALRLVELITPRDISKCAIGQCMYAPLCEENGGIVNDPIILRLAEDRFWLSIADSDVNLWVKGVAYGRGFDVKVFEPDVSPLGIQGPKADDLMAAVVGEHVRDIRFFRFIDETIAGTPVKLARSGWSGQGGYEIYLQDGSKGRDLWDLFWEAGQRFNIRSGAPNLIERLETGLKSYGTDMTIETNPLEAALDRFISLDKEAECMSMDAIRKIAATGPRKRLVNLMIEGDPLHTPRSIWRVLDKNGDVVGMVTSGAYSPRFSSNIAFATVNSAYSAVGTRLSVDTDGDLDTVGDLRSAVVHDAKWRLAS